MGKVLITGTSSGIGLATAVALARAGHTVFATMRSLERGAALRETVRKERLPVSILSMDVDSQESVDAATAAVRADVGSIDVLVNNAGVMRVGSVDSLALDDFRATMETNYFGALRTIRAWLPHMRTQRSGCIVNVSSVAGRLACSPLAPYAASKFALEALSEALAQEVKPFNIRVVVIEPGIVDTTMARQVEHVAEDPDYRQVRRFGHMFEAALESPTPPAAVADTIRDVIESGTAKLRHPVGPGAEGFLGWRAAMSDDDWVAWGALRDDDWYERVSTDFGLDARSKRRSSAAASTRSR
jgi:NAD(P)-dependent dehydrogenase (short-subunit alcohol dehydrogenase family)